jgi:hypothetical protein
MKLNREDLIWIASVAIGKRMDYETLKWSDYLYNCEDQADEVWEFVEECEEIGKIAWKEKYKKFRLYE